VTAAAAKFFQQSQALPTMPEVASRLIRSFDDDRASLASLAELVGKDPALAAKVMRMANSSRYSPGHTISTLKDAAAALGMDSLRNLALAACMSGTFPQIPGLDRSVFWRHGLTTAAYARLLSGALQLDADTAYLAGLMLRTGQILMALAQPAQVADVEAHVQEPGSRFSLEMHRFACTHADVTAELAARWTFPARLVEAFKDASAPMEARPFSLLAAVLHLAEILADAAQLQVAASQALTLAAPDLVEHLHLDLPFLESKIAAAGDLGGDVDGLIQ